MQIVVYSFKTDINRMWLATNETVESYQKQLVSDVGCETATVAYSGLVTSAQEAGDINICPKSHLRLRLISPPCHVVRERVAASRPDRRGGGRREGEEGAVGHTSLSRRSSLREAVIYSRPLPSMVARTSTDQSYLDPANRARVSPRVSELTDMIGRRNSAVGRRHGGWTSRITDTSIIRPPLCSYNWHSSPVDNVCITIMFYKTS